MVATFTIQTPVGAGPGVYTITVGDAGGGIGIYDYSGEYDLTPLTIGTIQVTVTANSAPAVLLAMSWKTHEWADNGSPLDFGINVLAPTGGLDIETRYGGVTKLVVGFNMDIQGVDGLDVTDVGISSGGPNPDTVTLSASNELTIEMSGTLLYVSGDSQLLTVTFPGIANASDVAAVCTDDVCIRQLVGNANYADFYLNSADLIMIRDVMSTFANSSTFRYDIEHDGYFNSVDLIRVRDYMSTYIDGSCD